MELIRGGRRVFMVTGAYGEIGLSICKNILTKSADHAVVLVGRNKDKGLQALEKLKKETSNHNVVYEDVDLSSFKAIRSFAHCYKESGRPLHVLINNAAIVPQQRTLSVDGLEMQFATNVMSYFWMSWFFGDLLMSSAGSEGSRIINVASNYAGSLDVKDLQFTTRKYNSDTAYRQSKQANRMLTVSFSNYYNPSSSSSPKIAINACHPGVVTSPVLSNLGYRGSQSADQGAATPVMLAVEDVGNVTGMYFSDKKVKSCPFGQSINEVTALWDYCMELTQKLDKHS